MSMEKMALHQGLITRLEAAMIGVVGRNNENGRISKWVVP